MKTKQEIFDGTLAHIRRQGVAALTTKGNSVIGSMTGATLSEFIYGSTHD